MKAKSLKKSIFELIVTLLIITIATIVINIWKDLSSESIKKFEEKLTAGQHVLEKTLSQKNSILYTSAQLLMTDFTFKQAYNNQDNAALKNVLINHNKKVNTDILALASTEGKIKTSTNEDLISENIFDHSKLIQKKLANNEIISILNLNNRIFQVAILKIDTSIVALIGFELDLSFSADLKDLTQLDISISTKEGDKENIIISTIPDNNRSEILSEYKTNISIIDLIYPTKQRYISRKLLGSDRENSDIIITLSGDTNTQLIEFRKMVQSIFMITIAAIIIAIFLAYIYSRKLSTPLTKITNFSDSLSRGEYDHSLNVSTSIYEFQNLTKSLDNMRENIRQREEKIRYQAQHDNLTKLFNRQRIYELVEKKFSMKKDFQAVGIMIFNFRGINDVYGYQNGDKCLQELALRIAKLRGLAARLIGAELLWLPDEMISDTELLEIKFSLEKSVDIGEVSIEFQTSMCLLECPRDANTPDQLFRRTSIILDESQSNNKLFIKYESRAENEYIRRFAIITELKKTLRSSQCELSLVYQPKLDLKNGEIIGAEALLRWNNQNLGFVPPDEFIEIAETADFIQEITDWVINQVINDLSFLRGLGIEINIAINLSAKDILNPNLATTLVEKLRRVNLETDAISLEITESDMVYDKMLAREQLNQFRNHGLHVAIDDFGTGYSSMAYLQQLPVGALKIDKSFIINLSTSSSDHNIVNTVIDLAHSFDLDVVAEGVENESSLKILKMLGCEYAQGYFICKPINLTQLVDWLSNNKNKKWLELAS